MLGLAGTVLQQQGSTYLQKGQAFMQSKMGFMSGGLLHYHFSVTGQYGKLTVGLPSLNSPGVTRLIATSQCSRCQWAHNKLQVEAAGTASLTEMWHDAVSNKLLMLLAPFLRQWNYTRIAEQVWTPHHILVCLCFQQGYLDLAEQVQWCLVEPAMFDHEPVNGLASKVFQSNCNVGR